MKKAVCAVAWIIASGAVWAQPAEDVPAEIRQLRERLGQERQSIIEAHERQAKACWQTFAVNDCLSAVRKSKRAHLDPVHQKELALNVQERAWRTRQRDERLQNKAADGVSSEH